MAYITIQYSIQQNIDGIVVYWTQDKQDALNFAAVYPTPCFIEEHLSHFSDENLIIISNKSFIEH